jgi:cytoskeletal protein CcmA (bactofilin family)
MSDPAVDLSLRDKPVETSRPALMPPRLADLRPTSTSGRPTGHAERRTMIVGAEVSLSGDITFCDRLVVAGNVEASLHECNELEISTHGVFKGNAIVATAKINGRFEGDLVVRKRLVIRAPAHVSGSITYGDIEIESGAMVAGILMPENKRGTSSLPPAFATRRQIGNEPQS